MLNTVDVKKFSLTISISDYLAFKILNGFFLFLKEIVDIYLN